MKFFALVTFIFMQQALAYETLERTNRDVSNGTSLFSYICDEERLQNVEDKLKILVHENENLNLKWKLLVNEIDKLHLKLDSLSLITSSINLQLTRVETAISNLPTATRQSDSTNSSSTCTSDHIMDILRNNSDSKSSQISVTKSKLPQLATSCAEAVKENGYKTGTYRISLPQSNLEPFYVYCLADPEKPETPWTIIQRRTDGSVDFYRKWAEYQKGFGNLEGEFFIGLDRLHALTQSTPHELWIKLEDFKNVMGSANYSSFAIGDNSEAYALKILGSIKGDVGDSLRLHVGQKFTTQDMDNDKFNRNCAIEYKGAWWYESCYHSNLNGKYVGDKNDPEGITWYHWRQEYKSLKYVHMAIRPVPVLLEY